MKQKTFSRFSISRFLFLLPEPVGLMNSRFPGIVNISFGSGKGLILLGSSNNQWEIFGDID